MRGEPQPFALAQLLDPPVEFLKRPPFGNPFGSRFQGRDQLAPPLLALLVGLQTTGRAVAVVTVDVLGMWSLSTRSGP